MDRNILGVMAATIVAGLIGSHSLPDDELVKKSVRLARAIGNEIDAEIDELAARIAGQQVDEQPQPHPEDTAAAL